MAESVEPDSEFRTSLRASLMRTAATALAPSEPIVTAPPAARFVPRRRLAIATACVVTMLGLGGMTSASASSLPGDALYPVKRATEQVQLTFTRGLADRGAFQLELAERRLDEARELSARGQGAQAAESVREFEETAAAGTADLMEAYRADNEPENMVVLNEFTTRTEEALSALETQLPAEGTAAVDDARDRIEAIDSRSEQLCSTCGGGSDESPASPDSLDDSPDLAPEPDVEPEPETEPEAAPPAEPSVSVPSDDSEDSDDSDDSDERDESDESDDERNNAPRQPVETVPPSPTPEPVPTPTPEPTPTPTPEPTPTDPVGGLLGVIPGALEGVGEAVGGTLGLLL
jgi:hypothetical protein